MLKGTVSERTVFGYCPRERTVFDWEVLDALSVRK